MSKKRLILISLLGIFIIAGLLVYLGQRQNRQREPYYSGTIEATQSQLSFQTGGRVAAVYVREGNAVVKNQLLAELDTSEWTARNKQAKATLEKAENDIKRLEIMLTFYRQSLPEEVTRAEANVKSLTNILIDAEKNNARYTQLFQRGVVAEKERDAVKLKYDNAKAGLKEGQAALQQSISGMKKIDATQMELEAARSQAEAARAAFEQTKIQSGYTSLSAPFDGIITSRNVEPGEVVTTSREVLTLSDLATVDLKIFVSETEIGKVKPGQPVDVKVDTFPNRTFKGKVSFISPEGEFTPKIIQTFKERVKLVYLVKITIPNPGYLLKPGMPADAWLR
ncbi:MAG: Multidrug resistance protein MdtN [Syntrophus sp. PtaB.Bin001]|nr:MAG: Multidrug resistance protein MdtN [Syntrophus sp. PtaB.Bin001]